MAHQNTLCLTVLRFKDVSREKGFEGYFYTCNLLESNTSWWVGPSRYWVGRCMSEVIWAFAHSLRPNRS